MRYRLAGVRPGDRLFGVHASTGDVFVTSDLRRDRGLAYLLIVEASLTSQPDLTSSTEIHVFVSRNEHAPVFSTSAYVISVPTSTQLGSPITTVSASDVDHDDVITYSLAGDTSCQSYFYLNPQT